MIRQGVIGEGQGVLARVSGDRETCAVQPQRRVTREAGLVPKVGWMRYCSTLFEIHSHNNKGEKRRGGGEEARFRTRLKWRGVLAEILPLFKDRIRSRGESADDCELPSAYPSP